MEIKRRQRDEREQQRTAVKERIQAALVLLINHLAFAVIALLLGSFAYVLAYADLGLGESWLARHCRRAFLFSLRLRSGFFQSRRMDNCRTDSLGVRNFRRSFIGFVGSPARKHRCHPARAAVYLRRSDSVIHSGRTGIGRRIHRKNGKPSSKR